METFTNKIMSSEYVASYRISQLPNVFDLKKKLLKRNKPETISHAVDIKSIKSNMYISHLLFLDCCIYNHNYHQNFVVRFLLICFLSLL